MKRIHFILLIFIFCSFSVAGQEKMIVVEDDWIVYTYQEASKTVSSLSKLPNRIQKGVKILIANSFAGFQDSIHFVNAQIVDIPSYLKNSSLHKREWVVPKYELNFYLKDASTGIIRYNIELHLDDYGQVLKINWPRDGAGNKIRLLSRSSIQDFALKEAKIRNYNLNKYLVKFEYSSQFDRLCWNFSFLEEEIVGGGIYNFIEVPWDELTIINSTKQDD